MPSLLTDYKDFIDWAFFYFDYDLYKIFPDKQTDSISSIENTIRTSFSCVKLISNDMESFEKNLKLSRERFEEALNKSRVAYSNLLTNIKKEVDVKKEAAQFDIPDENFIDKLKELHQKIMDAYAELKILTRKEDLLGSYSTEDERHDQCLRDIQPLINFSSFYNEKQKAIAYDYVEVRSIEFSFLTGLIEQSYDLYENSLPKVK